MKAFEMMKTIFAIILLLSATSAHLITCEHQTPSSPDPQNVPETTEVSPPQIEPVTLPPNASPVTDNNSESPFQ